MKTIFLVRHGETLANREGILQGWSNNPLDDTGEKQASALVTRASRVPLAAIYTSDLIRTQQTRQPWRPDPPSGVQPAGYPHRQHVETEPVQHCVRTGGRDKKIRLPRGQGE